MPCISDGGICHVPWLSYVVDGAFLCYLCGQVVSLCCLLRDPVLSLPQLPTRGFLWLVLSQPVIVLLHPDWKISVTYGAFLCCLVLSRTFVTCYITLHVPHFTMIRKQLHAWVVAKTSGSFMSVACVRLTVGVLLLEVYMHSDMHMEIIISWYQCRSCCGEKEQMNMLLTVVQMLPHTYVEHFLELQQVVLIRST